MNKSLMMENFDLLNTKGLKKSQAMEVALKSEESRNFAPVINEITVGLSSGTSGSRGLFLASSFERSTWSGSILAKALPQHILHKERIALFLRAGSNLYDSVKSNTLEFKFFDMIRPIDELCKDLEFYAPTILLAPASMLRFIAQAVEENVIKINVIKIFAIAEVLEKIDQDYLESVFNQKIYQIYQATEGFLAISCSHGNLHFNEDLIHIEKEYITESPNKFIPIITDFTRTTQPIIRYRLNDILVENNDPCPCGSANLRIERIEGRCDDIFYFHDISTKNLVPVFPDFLGRLVISSSEDISQYKISSSSPSEMTISLLMAKDDPGLQENFLRLWRLFCDRKGIISPQISFTPYEVHQGITKMKRVARLYQAVEFEKQ